MSIAKGTITAVPAQKFLFVDTDPSSSFAVSRRRVLESMKHAVDALNAAIGRIEATGDFDESEIDRTYERLSWAVGWFEEERLTHESEAKHNRSHRCGSIREVA